jgi:benzoyl-CoA reductase/2-hydroxyglutaryl-CoA dehydratase subunit BcrC/BadD/HgdB
MVELLELCGFEPKEIVSELPRIEKVFNKLGITAEDIERGKQRLTKYYDMELKGVRKMIRLLVKDVVNTVLAREEGSKKIVFGYMAPGFSVFSTALVSKSREVYAAGLQGNFHFVLGCIFDKIAPVLEAAENRWLKAGAVAHCGNVKTIVGLFALDLVPRPDLLVCCSSLCDTAPKTNDLLHAVYNIPTCTYDICADREYREYPAATERIARLGAKSLRRFRDRLQEVAGFEITDDLLMEVIDARRRLARATVELQNLIASSDPLVISANHALVWECLDGLSLSIDSLPDAIDAINTLYEELQERVNNEVGVVEKGAPRIVAILPSHFTDPRAEFLAGELGIAIVSGEPFVAQYVEVGRDVFQRLQMVNLSGPLDNCLSRRVSAILEGCKSLSVDGVLVRYHIGCRTTCGDALIIKDAIIKELGIPVLLQEREDFDPRYYDHDEFKRQLEVFKTMLVKEAS